MSLIQMPEIMYTGMDSLSKILDLSYKNVLIIADTQSCKNTNVTQILLSKAKEKQLNCHTVINDSCVSIFSAVQEKLMEYTPEILIAAGDGKVLDCACAISSLIEIPFATIPCVAPTALCDSDCIDAFLLKKLPSICVLEPEMIIKANSCKIAYEGLAMLVLAGESMKNAQSRYVRSLAKKAFSEIQSNLFAAYTGEISARESLLEAMHWAYACYVNSYEFSWESPAYRYCDFFALFDVDKLSLLATSCVQLLESAVDDNDVLQTVRGIRARLSVPRAAKDLGIDESEFLTRIDEISDEDKETFSLGYYGEQISQLV